MRSIYIIYLAIGQLYLQLFSENRPGLCPATCWTICLAASSWALRKEINKFMNLYLRLVRLSCVTGSICLRCSCSPLLVCSFITPWAVGPSSILNTTNIFFLLFFGLVSVNYLLLWHYEEVLSGQGSYQTVEVPLAPVWGISSSGEWEEDTR